MSLQSWTWRTWTGRPCDLLDLWNQTQFLWPLSQPSPPTSPTRGEVFFTKQIEVTTEIVILRHCRILAFNLLETREQSCEMCSRSKPDIKMEPGSGRPVDYQVSGWAKATENGSRRGRLHLFSSWSQILHGALLHYPKTNQS